MQDKLQSLQATFRQETAAYKDTQQELSKSHGSRQTFMQQQHESELVLQELELLDEDANIFKLIGPVLIKQDPLEAKTNVKKRLEFIKGESDRLDSQCKKLEDKQHKRQTAVRQLESQIQQIVQSASKAESEQ
ncbi:hypothetical protein ABBQ32_009073 [Trebouxia sp. C0010 RCD-2024]